MTNKMAPITPTKEEQKLIDTIRLEIEQGKQEIHKIVEDVRTRRYWTIGKHIKTYLLDYEDRAEYGKHLFELLEQEFGIERSTLHRTVKFFEAYPQIVAARPQLTWTHYKTLIAIPNDEDRQMWEEKAVQEHISAEDLQSLVAKDNVKPESTPKKVPKLSVSRDKPYVYQLKEVRGRMVVDLGFHEYREQRNLQGRKLELSETDAHYTYKAFVLDVLDGDTIWVEIDQGFDVLTVQKIRLRDIDSPEVSTPEGQKTKEYIQSQLKDCAFVAVKTHWRDKFDRYLVDIFYDTKESDLTKLIMNGTFLNQELLDKGLAVRYE